MTPEKQAATKSWNKRDGRWYRRWMENGKRHQTFNSRWLWELLHGEIPAGYEIHHIDYDKTNDSPDNFQCLTYGEHKRIHSGHPHIRIEGVEHRYCLDCGYRPLVEFGRKKTTYRSRCKKCASAAKAKWNRDNREEVNATRRTWRAKKKARENGLRKQH